MAKLIIVPIVASLDAIIPHLGERKKIQPGMVCHGSLQLGWPQTNGKITVVIRDAFFARRRHRELGQGVIVHVIQGPADQLEVVHECAEDVGFCQSEQVVGGRRAEYVTSICILGELLQHGVCKIRR